MINMSSRSSKYRSMKLDYENVIPVKRPTICSNCQNYGHLAKNCTKKPTCVHCSENHKSSDCVNTNSPSCFHCSGPHKAHSMQCPIYQTSLKKNNNVKTNWQTTKLKTHSGINICFLNIRSLYNKTSHILYTIHQLDLNVICLVETWLNYEIKNNELLFHGYKIFRIDRDTDTHGGGILILTKLPFSKNSNYLKQHSY